MGLVFDEQNNSLESNAYHTDKLSKERMELHIQSYHIIFESNEGLPDGQLRLVLVPYESQLTKLCGIVDRLELHLKKSQIALRIQDIYFNDSFPNDKYLSI